MEALVGSTLINGNDEQLATASICGPNKHIVLYFSAHWCPPCRGFTPKLVEFYNNFKASSRGDQMEIIFISCDRDEGSFRSYFGGMPWLAMPYGNDGVRESLGGTFGVSGIPAMLVLNSETGEVIERDGRGKLSSDPKGNGFPWG